MMKSLFRLSLPILLACMFAAALPAQDAAQKQSPEKAAPEKTAPADKKAGAGEKDAADPFAPKPPEGMELAWGDEFNADGRPDPKNWTFETGYVRSHVRRLRPRLPEKEITHPQRIPLRNP